MSLKNTIYILLGFLTFGLFACTPMNTSQKSKIEEKNRKGFHSKPSYEVNLESPQTILIDGTYVETELDVNASPLVGNEEFATALYNEINCPEIAHENGVEGVLAIRITINEKGEMIDAEIVRDIGAGCGKEALRVVKLLEKDGFNPAIKDGEPVNVRFILPIRFSLD